MAWLGCSSEEPGESTSPDAECPATCASVATSPLPGATVGTNQLVWVRVEPVDVAVDARVYGPDGTELSGFTGSGYGELDAGPLGDGAHEIVVSYSCAPAPAPPCFDESVAFTVDADAPVTGLSERHDVFVVEPAPVDLVPVLDDSRSMQPNALDQRAFAAELMAAALVPGIHIGVLTTTPTSDGAFLSPGWVSVKIADAEDRVQTLAGKVGSNGASEATGLSTSQMAVEASGPNGVNKDFARDDAHLIVVVVSDSDDYDPVGALEWVAWAEGLGRPDLTFVPVVVQSGRDAGGEYIKVADELAQPIYDFADLGQNLVDDVYDSQWATAPTTYCPLEDALASSFRVELEYDGEVYDTQQGTDWSVDGDRCVELTTSPALGGQLHLYYLPA